ncbi:Uncharacterised protein [Bordetella pertussis]|nr:Uncharacterised protein [Bordetella pertussis]CFW38707.1 Uncharacterised protein [Bordetella pertussis]
MTWCTTRSMISGEVSPAAILVRARSRTRSRCATM